MSSHFTVVYDACVLYPAPLRDLLMHLALSDLYRARWSDLIHDEWTRNVLTNRNDLNSDQLNRTRQLMNANVRDSLVAGFEYLIPSIELPDPDDRHVVAAAIHSGASLIVTFTGERIRDKIAASKRKGMWMGGVPPLGYDVVNRQLIVNEAEAAIVRRIFNEMLTNGSTTQIAAALTAEGFTTKAWVTRSGQMRSGARIDKKFLYKLLRNRVYLGEISHKGNWHPGVHAAIIDKGLWGQVHEILASDGHTRSVETKARSRTDALLRGLLYAPSGERMYPTYSNKNGRKYRYYFSKSEARFGAESKTYARLPADEVEAATLAQIKNVLSSPESVTGVCRFIRKNGAAVREDMAVMAMRQLGNVWEQLYPAEQHRIVNLMIERVDIVPGGLKVKWRELGWKDLIEEFAPDSIGAELVETEAA